ncbi:hypothetical protein HAX54_045796, partial [Datura stramonium]|nr:hypothetical protein [Datura stramonium]
MGLTKESTSHQPSDSQSRWFHGSDSVNDGRQSRLILDPFGLRVMIRVTDHRVSDGPSLPLSKRSIIQSNRFFK